MFFKVWTWCGWVTSDRLSPQSSLWLVLALKKDTQVGLNWFSTMSFRIVISRERRRISQRGNQFCQSPEVPRGSKEQASMPRRGCALLGGEPVTCQGRGGPRTFKGILPGQAKPKCRFAANHLIQFFSMCVSILLFFGKQGIHRRVSKRIVFH